MSIPSRPYKRNRTDGIDPHTGGVRIVLGGTKFPDSIAIVDKDDVEFVLQWRWHTVRPRRAGERVLLYASGYVDGGQKYMHRVLLGMTNPKVKVDHINGNGLDNRRSNLRVVTHQQNIFNRRPNKTGSSQYKGVGWSKQHNSWRVKIRRGGKIVNVGLYKDEIEAALAYDAKAIELFGEYAWLNFPSDAISGDAA